MSNDCGSDIDTTVILASENLPNDFLPDSLTICNGESQLLSPAFQSAISYLWHDGVNTPSHPVTGSGWYVLQMTYTCAVLSDSCYVSMIEAPVQFDLGNDTLLCASGFIQLTLPANTSDYIWQDGSIGNFYLISNSGVYSVEVKNQCGSISDTITVTDGPPAPVLDLGPDQSLCPGETIIFDPGISGVSYLWHNGSDESQFSATTPGTLSLTVDNICGSWTDTVIVFSDTSGPSVELGDSISSCAGKEVVLHANVSGVEYKWHDGSTGQDLTVTSTGLYAVTVSNACGEDSDRVFVDFLTSEPVVQLGIDTILCEGDTYTLLGSGNPGHEYLWNDGSAASSLEVIAAGQYFLTETNQCGSASDTILIDFYHRPPDFYLGPDTTVCDDADFILSSPSTPDIITWQDGSHSTEIVVNQSLTYRLEISNACATVSDEITIDVVNCNATQDVYFPNAFSPNFDGGNDVFQISFSPGAQPSEFVMNIFDRWGNEVFHTNDPQQCWDGSFKGSLLSPGVYTYIATFRLNGIVQQHAGDITLVR